MSPNSHIKSYFGPQWSISAKKLTKSRNLSKWSRIEHRSKWLQMSPNSHIKSSFGPFQLKSWPKVEIRRKWSRIEHRSKRLQMSPNSHIKSYYGPFQQKSCPKVKPDYLKSFWAMFDLTPLLTIFHLAKNFFSESLLHVNQIYSPGHHAVQLEQVFNHESFWRGV